MTFIQILNAFGGVAAVIVAVVIWLRQLATDRLISKWRRDEQALLEQVRDEHARGALLLEAGIKSFGSGQDITLRRRVKAAEQLWATVLDIRQRLQGTVFFFGILMPDEYANALSGNSGVSAAVASLSDDTLSAIFASSERVERHRPLSGETLWLYFYVYRAFLGRLTFLVIQGKQGNEIRDWRKDTAVRQHLSAVLTESELKPVFESEFPPNAVYRAVNLLEGKMLSEISRILSGERSSAESFENARTLHSALIEQPPGGRKS